MGVDQRPGVPYPEWNLWTKAFLKDHVAVQERKLLPGSSVAKPINANLRRFFEDPDRRAVSEAIQVLEHAGLITRIVDNASYVGLTRLGQHALETNAVGRHLG